MKWPEWYLLPFFFQAIAILFDEFYFHRKRGLPRWERVGHPLDTLSVLFCFLFLVAVPPSGLTLWLFVAIAGFSCFFITKDEFVHKDICTHQEMWLHALLFILHPVILGVAGWLWFQGLASEVLWFQTGMIFLFMLYQIFYWSFYAAKTSE